MATNSFKKAPPKQQKEEKFYIFRIVKDVLKLNNLFEDGIPVRKAPKVLFVVALIILYIGNSHYAERSVRKITKLERTVNDLRADYTTLKAEVMYKSKQSEVAELTKFMGLEESINPPIKIKHEDQ